MTPRPNHRPKHTASRARRACVALALSVPLTVPVTAAGAQGGQQCAQAGFRDPGVRYPDAKYDGRYTFVRIAYTEAFSARGGGGGGREPFWHHDYPDADQHLTRLTTELTSIKGQNGKSVIMTLDNPELAKFPVAYLVEAGHWVPSDAEALGLRNYLKKGGFLIFDDLSDRGNDWGNLEYQMNRVLPGMRPIELPIDHPIFDSFYRVKSLNYYHPYYCYKSSFWGIFVENDPKKRMMAVVNYNNDIGEAWEWSDVGYYSVDVSNEAYKLGINYIIYAMTR